MVAGIRFPVFSSPEVSTWAFTNTSRGQVGLSIWGVKGGEVNYYFSAALEQSYPTFMGKGHWNLPNGDNVPLWVFVIRVQGAW